MSPVEESFTTGYGRVLLMDDESIVSDVAGEMLNVLGYDVDFVSDGDEAVEAYRKAFESGRCYDIVIMDLTIPGGTGGKEAIKRLLSIDPGVKAIVSSGYSNDPVMAKYEEYGFSAVMTKPFSLESLSRTIHRVITREKS